jgi:hypothetical protein
VFNFDGREKEKTEEKEDLLSEKTEEKERKL